MNNKIKKIISIATTSVFVLSAATVGVYATDGIDYEINSTYQNVDWNTYSQYKTDLHTHSTASDGTQTKKETIESHYQYGFDIMALTDHGTVDYGWDSANANRIVKIGTTIRNGKMPIEPISSIGTAANGKTYTYDGTYYAQNNSNGTAGRSMMRVPFGNEQNPTSFNNAHVCTWFADYGNDSLGGTSDYETPIKNVDALGGLSVINHPGEYSGARDEQYEKDAYDTSTVKYNYIVNKFSNLLTDYNSCLGIDINSKGDYRTRYDRKLWDLLLQKVVPTGRNVYAIATSDAHRENVVNSGFTIMCMPEKTTDALKACMANGEFFAASRYVGSKTELYTWASELKSAKKATALAKDFSQTVNKIIAEENDGGQDTIYQFDANAKAPKVTGISVDDNKDVIKINTKDAYLVHWIADGKVIAVGNSIDLDEHSDEIGSYVRAEVLGAGGVIYTQAFTLEYDGAPQAENAFFYDLGNITTFLADTIVKVLAALLKGTGIVDLVWKFI